MATSLALLELLPPLTLPFARPSETAALLCALRRTCRDAARSTTAVAHLTWCCSGQLPLREACDRALPFLCARALGFAVRLGGTMPSAAEFKRLMSAPGLVELSCIATVLSDADISAALAEPPRKLHTLALSHCTPAISQESVRVISTRCRALTKLRISHVEAEEDLGALRSAAFRRSAHDASVLALRLESVGSEPTADDFCLIYPARACEKAEEPSQLAPRVLDHLELSHSCWATGLAGPRVLQRLMERHDVCAELRMAPSAASAIARLESGASLLAWLREVYAGENFALLRVQSGGAAKARKALAWKEHRVLELPSGWRTPRG